MTEAGERVLLTACERVGRTVSEPTLAARQVAGVKDTTTWPPT